MKDSEFSPEVKAIVDGRSWGRCEVCGDGRIAEYHHRRPRGAGGSKRPDTGQASNCLGLCHVCHRMIESHRTIALLLGWLVGQRVPPVAARVMWRGEWAMLTDDGQVKLC